MCIKKKGQAAEAGVALSGVEDTEVLIASTWITILKVKAGYLIRVVQFMYVPKKSCSTPWLQRRNELSRWRMSRLARSLVTERDGIDALEVVRFVTDVGTI